MLAQYRMMSHCCDPHHPRLTTIDIDHVDPSKKGERRCYISAEEKEHKGQYRFLSDEWQDPDSTPRQHLASKTVDVPRATGGSSSKGSTESGSHTETHKKNKITRDAATGRRTAPSHSLTAALPEQCGGTNYKDADDNTKGHDKRDEPIESYISLRNLNGHVQFMPLFDECGTGTQMPVNAGAHSLYVGGSGINKAFADLFKHNGFDNLHRFTTINE